MSINPIRILTANSVNVANGATTISVSGSVDCSRVYDGTAIFVNDFRPVEGISGTTFDTGTGVSTITLKDPWPHATVTGGGLTAINTIEGLGQAIQRARDIVQQTSGIESLAGTGFVERTGSNTFTTISVTTLAKQLLDDADTTTMRATLGLGNASTKNVQTDAFDNAAGAVLIQGAHGLGGFSNLDITDVNTSDLGFLSFSASAANTPFTGTSTGFVCGYAADKKLMVLGGITDEDLYYQVNNAGWQGFHKVLSTNNTNLYEFSSNAAGDVIAVGEAISATEVRFYLPISSTTTPTSLTVSGTFDVVKGDTTVTAGTSSLVLDTRSSSKVAVVKITGLSGYTAGDTVQLRTVSSTDKVTINF